jgi:predicted acylesterase/phospholipase RssA
MIKNVKRFAGASAGAICATFLALGFSSSELKKKLGTNFYDLLIGKFSFSQQAYFENRMVS